VTYHIRNRATTDRTFTLEHTVRPNWSSVGEKNLVEGSTRFCQFTVKAEAGKLVRQPVAEERIVPKKESVNEIDEERVKTILASAAIKDSVKESLKKAFEMRTSLEQTVAMLKDLRGQATEISAEQARLRTNMEKLPQESELYKRYLKKLDQEETSLEKIQGQVKDKETEERTQKKDLEGFLEKLNVE
jgi:hypothetical protein